MKPHEDIVSEESQVSDDSVILKRLERVEESEIQTNNPQPYLNQNIIVKEMYADRRSHPDGGASEFHSRIRSEKLLTEEQKRESKEQLQGTVLKTKQKHSIMSMGYDYLKITDPYSKMTSQ